MKQEHQPFNSLASLWPLNDADWLQSMAKMNSTLCELAQEFQAPDPNLQASFTESMSQATQRWWEALITQNPMMMMDQQLSCIQKLHEWSQEYVEFLSNPQKPSSWKDRRFKQDDWEQNPYFRMIKDLYLIYCDSFLNLISTVQNLDPQTTRQINYLSRQWVEALSPANFLMTNPEVIKKTIETNGQNLLKGFEYFLEDLKNGHGQLRISMTDYSAFEVGTNLATTPGQVVFQNDLIQLIQYTPTTPQVFEKPLLIIPPWINKFYILDLQPQNSLVKWLVDHGHTVFMISWNNPNEQFSQYDFEDYMFKGPLAAIEAIQKTINVTQMNALGFCIGGTLLGATLAYMAAQHDQRISSATYLTTLLDFSDPGDLGVFIDEIQLNALDAHMKAQGYLSGANMALTFNTLRATDLIWNYVIGNYLLGKTPIPYDLLYWNADSTNMPWRMHSNYLRWMYLENKLIQPFGLTFNHTPLDLRQIKIPAYFLSALSDHIAPWKTTYQGALAHSGKVQFVLSGSGHIASVVNPPQAQKYSYRTTDGLPDSAERFLNESIEHLGSWWSHWQQWLAAFSGQQVAARDPKQGKLSPIEPAPGSYVKIKYGK